MTEQIAKADITLGEDFMRHRVSGYVNLTGKWFEAPLITQVEGNLWQGGCLHQVRLPEGFKYVVSLYPWESYILPEGCQREEIKMYDSLNQEMDQVEEIAQAVVGLVDLGPTLVHCQAGLNRSGLIAARALMYMGRDAEDAIQTVRRRSDSVLSNPTFEAWLRETPLPKEI